MARKKRRSSGRKRGGSQQAVDRKQDRGPSRLKSAQGKSRDRKVAGAAPGPRVDLATAVVANLLMLAALGVVLVLREISSDLYYASSQEDETLEWATVWAFLIAAAFGVAAAWHQRRSTGKLPWFVLGVSLFCFFVAMEEISWGQRILGYRPPEYFLANNFQQELNVHNVVSTDLRKLAVKGVLLGFGVVLPLAAALLPALRKQLTRWAVVVSPVALSPSFLVAYLVYEEYPWSFTGEWVEVMMGLGFLFAAIVWARELDTSAPAGGPKRLLVPVVASALLVLVLGVANAAVSRHQRAVSPEILETARVELEALKRDFLSGKVETKCSRHRRLYTFKEKYGQDYLLEGEFAALTEKGLPEERAEFFLDPWNSPYWIRDRCKNDGRSRVVFVYSFGPNRRRESTRWELRGDDVGAIILEKGLD